LKPHRNNIFYSSCLVILIQYSPPLDSDLCDPTLLDLVRPGCPDLSQRSQNLKTGVVNKNVVGPVNVSTPTFTLFAHFQPSPNSYPASAPYLTMLTTVTPTRMTHHAATPLTTNPYSRLMMPHPYYSPYPGPYQPTFHYPNTPPTQWRTTSQIPNVSSSSHNLDSNLALGDSIQL
jgi:hypothetical protein